MFLGGWHLARQVFIKALWWIALAITISRNEKLILHPSDDDPTTVRVVCFGFDGVS